MAILSRLKPLIDHSKKNFAFIIRKSHERKMIIKPSSIITKLSYNYLSFYFFLFGIPIYLFGAYFNIFYGLAELSETPEGYTPEYYEYEKNPISRILSKYIHDDIQRTYEYNVAEIGKENDMRIYSLIKRDIKYVMSHYNDYEGWFNETPNKAKSERIRRYDQLNELHKSFKKNIDIE